MTAPSVSTLMAVAFAVARNARPELTTRWITASYWVSSHLSNSLLLVATQKLGEVDTLLRAMEDEAAAGLRQGKNPMVLDLGPHYQLMLSEFWIGSAYEILRTIKKSLVGDTQFETLYRNLELIRVPLEKHRLRGDWGLGKTLPNPLPLTKIPDEESSRNGVSGEVLYDVQDERRGYIMPVALSETGSAEWQVIDLEMKRSFWLRRSSLADEFLTLCEAGRAGGKSGD
ncbi:hypothetical protein ACFSM5_06545 [Lacibacterium aquatile]|uniref:Uncharacterized protein n=1 Tax=Lacibacterium aquatile TaxID=1168082 RepID=A0ABW5DTD9_9PROT